MSTEPRAEDPAAAAPQRRDPGPAAVPSAPLAAVPTDADADAQTDLDARIRDAEERLIAREQDLRRRWGQLSSRVQHAVSPRRLAVPLFGAALAGVALWWLWRGRAPALAGARDGGAELARPRGAPVDWLSMPLLGLVWPLLPPSWRARVSPGLAQSVVSMGLPLLQGLLAPRDDNPPATMAQVDLARYAGTWFEIARLPASGENACSGQPSAHYTLRDDGTLEVVHRWPGRGGVRSASGLARPVAGSGGARLEVSSWPAVLRWLPFAWSDVWILHLDEDYSQALIGSPGRRHLWILSREPTLARERLLPLLQMAEERGYAVERLEFALPQ